MNFLDWLSFTSLLLRVDLNFQTLVTQQVGHGQSSETFLTTQRRNKISLNFEKFATGVIVNSLSL